MLYDCFMFYNELELLDIRLNILDDYVDKFVLVEATTTLSGNPKPLYFEQHKERFRPFEEKIVHVRLEDDPGFEDPWARENFQRNAILRGLSECEPSDRIVISDLDEIPNPETLARTTAGDTPVGFQQLLFYYYLNNLNKTTLWWTGSVLIEYGSLGSLTPNAARKQGRHDHRNLVKDGGWHFSFLGDAKFIQDKISAYAHQEINNEAVNSEANIRHAIDTRQDLLGRNYKFVTVVLDESFPRYIISRTAELAHLISEPTKKSPRVSSVIARRGWRLAVGRRVWESVAAFQRTRRRLQGRVVSGITRVARRIRVDRR